LACAQAVALCGAPTTARRHVAAPCNLPPLNMAYDEYDNDERHVVALVALNPRAASASVSPAGLCSPPSQARSASAQHGLPLCAAQQVERDRLRVEKRHLAVSYTQ
jgi:hypothetical protein